jgi:hypothetical protein
VRWTLIGLTVACLALVAVSVAPAKAPGGGRVIRFLEVDNQRGDIYVDADHNNRESSGDIFMGSFVLYSWAKGGGRGERIGHAKVMCTFRGASSAYCTGTFFIPGGSVVGESFIRFSNAPIKIPVVGGTGAYVGARGTFSSRTIRDNGEVSLSADVIRLLP